MNQDPRQTKRKPAAGSGARGRRRPFRAFLSVAAVGAVGSAAVFTTQATFTDQVTMAQVTVAGGTLDLQANGGDGPNQAWSIAMATTGMVPGQEQSGNVVISNNGTLPFTMSLTTTGTDASGCFSHYFRETSATGASRAAAWPVNVAGMGTAAGADGSTAPMATGVTSVPLNDNTGADAVWETDDTKTYTLTVRMKTACATNGATGSMNVTLNATQ